MVSLVHQFGLFEFKTGKISLPSTPTHRSKASIFGLDAISRNLLNSRPGSSMGDFFSGSRNGSRRNRSRSTTSRFSMYTQTTTTAGSMKSSHHRSNSTATAATTMSTMDDDTSFSSKGKKLSKRSTSLVDAGLIQNMALLAICQDRGRNPDHLQEVLIQITAT
jgi:protein ECT2